MQRNRKLAILIVFMIVAIFVWIPKSKKPTAVSANTSSAALDQTIPLIKTVPRKRTEFVGWPRDPFAKLQTEKGISSVSDFKLGAIMWGGKNPSAFINGKFVSTGDKVDDKTVKRIDKNRVILTDGTNDYVLKL